MPVHDWSRIQAGIFHDFHQRWIISLSNALNQSLLPEGYYALAEQSAGGLIPDVITLEQRVDTQDPIVPAIPGRSQALAVLDSPPQTQYSHAGDTDGYARRATHVVIRHASGDRVVGYIEIVSPGNKQSEAAIHALFEKLHTALRDGCHLLIVDLLPPTKRDQRGLHAEFWSRFFGDDNVPGCDEKKPLGMAAYHSINIPKAYFQPFAVGDKLINMPVFLTKDHYVSLPLERTYLEAWNGVPKRWQDVIDNCGVD
jgi:hypothetical protein